MRLNSEPREVSDSPTQVAVRQTEDAAAAIADQLRSTGDWCLDRQALATNTAAP